MILTITNPGTQARALSELASVAAKAGDPGHAFRLATQAGAALVTMQPDGTWAPAGPEEVFCLYDIYQALARTALLIEVDSFPGTDHRVIIDGLRATTARIISNRANIASPAGQTALATLYALLAMLGLQIDLDVPAVGLAADQPPLRGSDLAGARRPVGRHLARRGSCGLQRAPPPIGTVLVLPVLRGV